MMPHPIGPTIRRLRLAQGRTLDQLTAQTKALRMPLGDCVIARIERGNVYTCTFDTLVAIAGALGMPLSQLIAEWERDAEQAKAARVARAA